MFVSRGNTLDGATVTAYFALLSNGRETTLKEKTAMKLELWKLYARLQHLIAREEGQDLIEYALVVALIAFAATAGMTTLAQDINNAFIGIGTSLTNAVG
jgi:pilus assembly protein Flp/PilA